MNESVAAAVALSTRHCCCHTPLSSLYPDFPKPAPTKPNFSPKGGWAESPWAGGPRRIPGPAQSPAPGIQGAERKGGSQRGRDRPRRSEAGAGEAAGRGGRAGSRGLGGSTDRDAGAGVTDPGRLRAF